MGIPCSHKIKEALKSNCALAVTDFDQHWRLHQRSQAPPTEVQFLDPVVAVTRGRPVGSSSQLPRASQVDTSTRREPSAFEHVERIAQSGVRKCGVCGVLGHNRRRCVQREPVDENASGSKRPRHGQE